MMNVLISCYVGGCIVGLMDARDTDTLSMSSVVKALGWPISAVSDIVLMVSNNTSKIMDIISDIVTVGTTVVTWVVKLFKKG